MDLTRSCSFACERPRGNVRVLVFDEASHGVDARVRFRVLELKAK